MNPKRLAQALNTIAVGFAEAAEALNQPSEPSAPSFDDLPPLYEGPVPGDQELRQPTLAEVSTEFVPEGHLSICPKHKVEYREGRYGPFCPSITDDAAWGREKDGKLWCKITPKNAAEWLRMQAAA